MWQFSCNSYCVRTPDSICNKLKVSLLIRIGNRTSTKVSLDFTICCTNCCIRFLNNKSITWWSCSCTIFRKNITNTIDCISCITVIYKAIKVCSWSCITKNTRTKTYYCLVNGIISCCNFNVPLPLSIIKLNRVSDLSRILITDATYNS